jgi:hypothetical protein
MVERLPGGIQAAERGIKVSFNATEDAARGVIEKHTWDRGLDLGEGCCELAERAPLDPVGGDRLHWDRTFARLEGRGDEPFGVCDLADGERESRLGYAGVPKVKWLPELLSEERHGINVAPRVLDISQCESCFQPRQVSEYQLGSVADPTGDIE